VSSSLSLRKMPSYSASHPDPSCLHIELDLIVNGRLRTNQLHAGVQNGL